MPRYQHSAPIRRTHSELVQAVRNDEDLPDEEWDRLWKLATPQQRRVARMIVDPECAPHGEASTYTNWGCKCAPCTKAYNESRLAARLESDFPDSPPPAEPAPAGDWRKKPRDEMTQTEKAVLAVENFGYENTSPMAQQLYDTWRSEQDAAQVI